MQINSNTSDQYYTPFKTNTNMRAISGAARNAEGKLEFIEAEGKPSFVDELADYQEIHRAWMSQGATTAFSYTENHGFNAMENSISLVPGMTAGLGNGFRLLITRCLVQTSGDIRNNEAAKESAAVAGALDSLIRVANGQIPINLFYSKTQDNSAYAKKGLRAFGIDISRPFIINGKKFYFDDEGQIRLGEG